MIKDLEIEVTKFDSKNGFADLDKEALQKELQTSDYKEVSVPL